MVKNTKMADNLNPYVGKTIYKLAVSDEGFIFYFKDSEPLVLSVPGGYSYNPWYKKMFGGGHCKTVSIMRQIKFRSIENTLNNILAPYPENADNDCIEYTPVKVRAYNGYEVDLNLRNFYL